MFNTDTAQGLPLKIIQVISIFKKTIKGPISQRINLITS